MSTEDMSVVGVRGPNATALDMSLDEMIAKTTPKPSRTKSASASALARGQNSAGRVSHKFDKADMRPQSARRAKQYDTGPYSTRNYYYNSRENALFNSRRRTPWDMYTTSAAEDLGPNELLQQQFSRHPSQQLPRLGPIGDRLVRITGLEYSVLKEDLVELFSVVGPIRKCWIDFDRTARSMGTGGVIFEFPEDARRAVAIFDGKTLDGSVIALKIHGKMPFTVGTYESGVPQLPMEDIVVSRVMKRRYEY